MNLVAFTLPNGEVRYFKVLENGEPDIARPYRPEQIGAGDRIFTFAPPDGSDNRSTVRPL